MPKYKLKIFFKRLNELILVLLQFVIIFLHFIKWKFIPEKDGYKKMTRIHLELFKFFNKIGNYFYRKHVNRLKKNRF